MSRDDLDRVQADLAVMKSICAESPPARDEVAVWLFLTAYGLLLAGAAWTVPVDWIRLGTVAIFSLAGCVYAAYWWRVAPINAARRHAVAADWRTAMVAILGVLIYMGMRHFTIPDAPDIALGVWRQDASLALFAVGLAVLAYSLTRGSRRRYAPTGAALAGGGILIRFTVDKPSALAAIGLSLTLASVLAAVNLALAIRSEKREHGNH